MDVIRVEDGKVGGGFSTEGLWCEYETQQIRTPEGIRTRKVLYHTCGLAEFSADGKRVLLTKGGVNASIQMGLWDVATGKRLQTFRMPPLN